MARHFIGLVEGGKRFLFRAEFNDEEFIALPYIRRHAALPPGFVAWHIDNPTTDPRVPMLRAMPVVIDLTTGLHASAQYALSLFE